MGRWRSSLQTVIIAAIASSTVFTSDGFAGLDVGGWEMVMTSGRSGNRQPRIIDDAAIKASPVNKTLSITEPVQVRARFVALRVSWQPNLMSVSHRDHDTMRLCECKVTSRKNPAPE